ncbi:MAG TPA: MATE family efflux transporter [Bacillota bacterium]|jgi:putative MATE family efflux protein
MIEATTTIVKNENVNRLRREIFLLAWPAIIELILHTLVWNVDTAFMGRVGADAVAAVGNGGQVYWTVIWAFGGLGTGVTALVARAIGAGRRDAATGSAAQALRLAFFCGLAVMVTAFLGAGRVMGLTSLPAATQASAATYIRILAMGAPVYLPAMIALSAIRATGDTRTPMFVTGLLNVVNIILAWGLVFGHFGNQPLGVIGSALAAVLAQVFGAGLALAWVFSPRCRLGLRLSQLTRGRGPSGELARLSLPSGVESLTMDTARTFGMFFVTALGSVASAASYVSMNAEAFSFMPGYGFAVAASILAGQKLGAGDEAGAKEAVRQCLVVGMAVMGGIGLFFLAVPSLFVRIFTGEPAVVRMASQCLRVAGFAQPLMAVTDILCGSLRGAGNTRTPLFITMGGAWLVRVPLTFVLVAWLKLPVYYAWVAMLADWGARAVVTFLVFRTGRWLKTRVRVGAPAPESAAPVQTA